MSYRIRLEVKEKSIEIRDETPISKFQIVKWTEQDEYPNYVVDKKTMMDIIVFYQKNLTSVAEKKIGWEKPNVEMFWYNANIYFCDLDENTLIKDSSNFFLQYFYLVDIYRNTDWGNETLKITHW